MSSRVPARTPPIGQPSPFERSTQAVSISATKSLAGMPLATTAFISRAPSMCVFSPCSWATAAISRIVSSGQTLPVPPLVVFSIETSRERAECGLSGLIAPRTCSAVNSPRAPSSSRDETPASAAGPPPSLVYGWASRCRIISSPIRVWTLIAIALHIVPDGRKSASSLPNRSATISCNRLTVGSSRRCSSPTSASAMKARISRDGFVAVSLDRSINRSGIVVPPHSALFGNRNRAGIGAFPRFPIPDSRFPCSATYTTLPATQGKSDRGFGE